jgi:hypothetical protein
VPRAKGYAYVDIGDAVLLAVYLVRNGDREICLPHNEAASAAYHRLKAALGGAAK